MEPAADGGRVAGIHHLFLPHGDFEEGWRFWTEVVGLPPGPTWGEGADRAGMAGLGPQHLVVSGAPPGPQPEFGTEGRRGVPQVFLRAEGLDALCAAMRERGARILREPFDTHWGPRAFSVEGPDGLVAVFVEDAKPS